MILSPDRLNRERPVRTCRAIEESSLRGRDHPATAFGVDDGGDRLAFGLGDWPNFATHYSRSALIRPHPQHAVQIDFDRSHSPRKHPFRSEPLYAASVIFDKPAVSPEPEYAVAILSYRPDVIRRKPVKQRDSAPLVQVQRRGEREGKKQEAKSKRQK